MPALGNYERLKLLLGGCDLRFNFDGMPVLLVPTAKEIQRCGLRLHSNTGPTRPSLRWPKQSPIFRANCDQT